jgi:hypothetical protein
MLFILHGFAMIWFICNFFFIKGWEIFYQEIILNILFRKSVKSEMHEKMTYDDSPGFDEIIEKLEVTQSPHNQARSVSRHCSFGIVSGPFFM